MANNNGEENNLPNINPDTLPQVRAIEPELPQIKPQGASSPVQNSLSSDSNGPANSKFSFLKTRIVLILVLFFLIIVLTGGGIYLFLNQKVTNYTLIPDDTQFYLGLSVKKHPQVQKLLDLTKKFPGGEKMVKYIDKFRFELFGQRKDPFKEILDLAGEEIFLAKISSGDPSANSFGVNPLEKLVNIVAFKNSKAAKDNLQTITLKENIVASQESYQGAKISKLILKAQKETERSQTYSTGALPYQVTLPLSKDIYATAIDNFIVSAEKQSDVKKIIDLVSGSGDKKLKSLADDEGHREVASNFPKEYLVKFYQKQVINPFANLGLTSLPGPGRYDTGEQESEGDNVYETKLGLTIVAKDNGVDFTSYQYSDKNALGEGLKHGFTFENSLASKLPSSLGGNQILFYGEIRDLKGTIEDQNAQLKDVAANSSDKVQKERFDRAVREIDKAKEEFKKLTELDVDEDILSWMDQNSAWMVTSGTGGKAPEILFISDVKDPKSVENKLSRMKVWDFGIEATRRKEQAKDAQLKNDVGMLATALQGFYVSPGQGVYPDTLDELVKTGNLKELPKTANGENYTYLLCNNNTEAAVFGKLGVGGTYWGWSSEQGRAGDTGLTSIPATCNFTVIYKSQKIADPLSLPRIGPQLTEYNNSKIYSILIYNWKGEDWGIRYTFAGNLAVFSIGANDLTLKELIDGGAGEKININSRWKEQFENAPTIVGSIAYIVPENILGIVDYIMAKTPEYQKELNEDPRAQDAMTVARGYLKTVNSIGATITQNGKTIISNSFVNIEELVEGEKKSTEDALDRLLSDERLSPTNVLGATSSRINFGNFFREIF